ncbi:alpha-galactosidase [Clavibacter michiganensis]|uniref:alpha-galactosidase n=1 Tax=Clavibacter michiganensis TaxID=28447 RepID=UPI00292DD704|nr:alpha-galactosidase [Clavibacter michiganensis]
MPDTAVPSALLHLRASGVSLVLDLTEGRLPAVVHWGADLGDTTAADLATLALAAVEPIAGSVADDPIRLAILPEAHTSWTGKPGLEGHRDGADWSPLFRVASATVDGDPLPAGADGRPGSASTGPALVHVDAVDEVAGLGLALDVELLASGLVRTRAEVTNTGEGTYSVGGVTIALPLPAEAREILDFAGRWGLERTPQRRELVVGIHEREGRKGRTGPDAATLLSVGTPGFGFRQGEVRGVHVAFSGNHRHYAERLSTGRQVIGGGELLLPGEVRLARGESYASPWVYAAYGDGLDDQASRFHRHLRARDTHPRRDRPMTINVWEAVYFDHDLARLTDLADRAAALGVERYVLDDGWFRHRRDDHAGLGDWYVDEGVWPDGLGPIIDHVTGLGMEFGIWFEPEMVNEDSDLARAHPEWIMATGGRLPVRARDQQVLDLAIPEAYDHVLERMTAILSENDIAYIKWDHNRDLVDAGIAPRGEAGVHLQTLAAYRLMDELKARFPGLEIESCSSGGSRVDLGVLERTDRVWVSDCIDPLDRQTMMRWTMQLLPPELMGSHIASGVSHTTGRAHRLAFRAGSALYGHLGIEWDLAQATDEENADLAAWIALYKEERALMHTGTVVRADESDPTLLVYGAVASDAASALFFLASIGRSEVSPRGRFLLPGLDPARRYRVEPVRVGTPEPGFAAAAWWDGVELTGRALAASGLHAPLMLPESVAILRVTAV